MDGRFESKRNEQLNNISEEDILYFEGFYEVNGYLQSVREFVVMGELDSNFRMFGINMLYRLDQLGVEQYLIRNLYSTLFKEYVIEEKRLGEGYYKEFLDIWNNEYEDVLREWVF